ncbi:hypothetical protein AGR4B_Lc70144 [Agrobacterium tumefaciens str. CFBP 5621]|nr:hypothetical protein AGR4B_Lc70144 [Agrobacterium tumefaciens str. CFBP 5621]
MVTIFYESLPVPHLTFDSEWRLDYGIAPIPLRSGPVAADGLGVFEHNLWGGRSRTRAEIISAFRGHPDRSTDTRYFPEPGIAYGVGER